MKTTSVGTVDEPGWDRRTVLKAAGATAALIGLGPDNTARAAVSPHRFTHGAFEIIVVSDGHLVLPTAFIAPDAPTAERDAALASSGQTGAEYSSPTNVTLIKSGSELILIDTGSGAHFMPTAGKLAENLEAAGIDKDKINTIVFTHAHPDHIWGTIDDLDDLTFPNARYVVANAEWDFWRSAGATQGLPAERAGFVTGARRNLDRIKDKVRMAKPGDDIVTGIRVIETGGHTQGHVSLEIAGGDGLVIAGDALTHPVISFQHFGWRTTADHEPERAIRTRKRLLDRLVADKTRLIGFHLPWPGVGVVERKDSAYRFVAT